MGPTFTAFVKILGPFLIYFNTWGLLLSFGVFQSHYEQLLLHGYSPSSISWIGTIAIFLLLVCGAISGPAYDQGYQRYLLILGHAMVLFAVFMLSLSTKMYQILLAQGICFGLGSGFLYVPSVAGISRTFTKHRNLALGVAMSGAGLGGIVFSVMLEQLLNRLSFGWAVRILGFVMIFTTTITMITMLPEPVFKAPESRLLIDPLVFRDSPFMLFCVAGFFNLLAYYLPFLYTPAVAARVGASKSLQTYLITIINGASLLGRIIPSKAADTFGALRSFPVALASAAVVLFCWPAVNSVAGLVVWSCAWGFFSGILIIMPGAVVPPLSPSPGLIGTRMGIACTISAFGFLIGGPIGGRITSSGSLIGMQLFAAASMLCAAGLSSISAIIKEHWKLNSDSDESSMAANAQLESQAEKKMTTSSIDSSA